MDGYILALSRWVRSFHAPLGEYLGTMIRASELGDCCSRENRGRKGRSSACINEYVILCSRQFVLGSLAGAENCYTATAVS